MSTLLVTIALTGTTIIANAAWTIRAALRRAPKPESLFI